MAKIKQRTSDNWLKIKVRLSVHEKLNVEEFNFLYERHIKGLLKVKKKYKKKIEYSGPVGINLEAWLKNPISKHDLFFLLEQIVEVTKDINANALNINKIVWDIKHVYINERTKEIRFIYLPFISVKAEDDIFSFLEAVIYSSNPIKNQNNDYISKLIFFIRNMPTYVPDKLEQYIMVEDRNSINMLKNTHTDDDVTGLLNNNDIVVADIEPDALSDEGATCLLNDEGETCLLQNEQTPVAFPKLYRVKTGEEVLIDKPVFRIGKEKISTDYFVNNNGAVSRNHADIVFRNRKYYVMDLNSKNRTYINDCEIPAHQETEICNGDRLKLADEEFIFYTS